jgi:hypothetical protein
MLDGKEGMARTWAPPIYSTPIVANGVLYFASNAHFFAIHEPSKGVPTRSISRLFVVRTNSLRGSDFLRPGEFLVLPCHHVVF